MKKIVFNLVLVFLTATIGWAAFSYLPSRFDDDRLAEEQKDLFLKVQELNLALLVRLEEIQFERRGDFVFFHDVEKLIKLVEESDRLAAEQKIREAVSKREEAKREIQRLWRIKTASIEKKTGQNI